VALSEVLAALLAAWLRLGEIPNGVQILDGVLILASVVAVKLGEPRPASPSRGQTADAESSYAVAQGQPARRPERAAA
jgi:hypothetical protein